ncbi:MAG: DNA polymerase IV [Bacteroidetes bacterium]|nr:DNA polymerase IV [Bacteroidota bacterium]
MRKIIHLDMDAFYASVEQRDHPEWRGKPLAVGGSGERGVIAAASYEARKFGVRSAMSGRKALELCPELIFAPLRFKAYKEVSSKVNTIFSRYTNLIEPLALDEAYLDVTENFVGLESATFIAQSIKNDIYEETGLTASAGVSYNKFLAKLASDEDKPNGLFVIEPKDALQYLEQLPIGKFYGVGSATEKKFKEFGIFKGKDLLYHSQADLLHYFGKSGGFLYNVIRGEDNRPVLSNRERKSLGVETTFQNNIANDDLLWFEARKLLENLQTKCENANTSGRTLTFKIRFSDFSTHTKSRTEREDILNLDDFLDLGVQLYSEFIPLEKEVRLIGFSISGFDKDQEEFQQLSLRLD